MEVRPGYKQTEIGIVPEDWDVFELGDLIEYTKGFAFKSGDYQSDGTRIVRVSDTTFDSIKDGISVYIDSSKANSYKRWKLKENDLIISTVGSKPPMWDSLVGKVIRVNTKYAGSLLNQNAVLIRAKGSQGHKQYILLNNLRTERYIRHIELIYRGNANQASITLDELFSFQLALPRNEAEQRAIAAALSDVDALLAGLDALIAKKRLIKQGAMQELLSGKRRLPGFSGEWKVCLLGEKVEIIKGQLITENNAIKGSIPVIAGGKHPAYYHNKSNRTGKTITISASGANAGFVAFFNIPIFASDCSTIGESAEYSIEFVYQQLLLDQQKIYKLQTGGAQPHIHSSDLAPIKFCFPLYNEQVAIAKILSDMDAEISALEQRREKTRLLKQGMMQELLTGRIRLVVVA